MPTHAELIEALGGTVAVAEACGVEPPVVSLWKRPERGIAWQYRGLLATMALRKGLVLPRDFLIPKTVGTRDVA